MQEGNFIQGLFRNSDSFIKTIFDKPDNVVTSIFGKLKEEKELMGHVNIIIAGKTGVGKSTLINSVFRENLADTGIGNPVTQELKEITKEDIPLRLYDTVGLELDSVKQDKVLQEIRELIREKARVNDPDKSIHCIWYCINASSNRIEDTEANFIKELASNHNVPVIVVMTQSISEDSKAFCKFIEHQNLPVKRIFRVLAADYHINSSYCIHAFGCDELVEFVIDLIPEYAQTAFVNAQKASFELKRKKAHVVVGATAATAFGVGFVPIPFSDAATLVPAQIAMIAKMTNIYGLSVSKGTMSSIVTSLLGTTSATIIGRSIVANVVKFIPGVGIAVGGTISGGTAAVLTTALGETYIYVLEQLARGTMTEQDLSKRSNMKEIAQMFKLKMKTSRVERSNESL